MKNIDEFKVIVLNFCSTKKKVKCREKTLAVCNVHKGLILQ